ncbi:hypothetical protein Tco_0924160 [Tanacetum coccineum]|uniref:Uncharacterized protein n=1 Tax=Tanacetum coccineum TaxID=301880 RepID=A0ABQ5D322_9ASTR
MMATSQQSAAMSERIGTLERDNMRLRAMLCVERERIDNLRRHMAYTQEELRPKQIMDINKGKEKMVIEREVIIIESDTSCDHKPFQATSDESSDHNPFEATQ